VREEVARIPRLVIAGASSGSGKTTVTVALCRAFRQRGLRVAMFKCGPDYLDPTYHARAAGEPSHNLDGWMMGRDAARETLVRGARGCDLALIEGMMGVFDGASPRSEEGTTAQIAKWLEAPVVLVLDASGISRTFAALTAGLTRFDPELWIAGTLANKVGGRGHVELLQRVVEGSVPLLGGLPKRVELAFPERHLGLVTADERVLPDERLRAWGSLAEQWCRIDALLEVARSAPPLKFDRASVESVEGKRCRIAIAQDAAFHFYYLDNLRRLEAFGAELVPFSPLADVALPMQVGGIYIGGGYPEMYAESLAQNDAMRAAIRAFALGGGPIYAECGGLMYLTEGIQTVGGRRHLMLGLIPGISIMSDKLEALGYVEIETTVRSILGPAGTHFRGHQFRHSRLDTQPRVPVYRIRSATGAEVESEGYGGGNVLASYVHAHWASNPLVPQRFVEACSRFEER
jgi:cobyrinic acid a,c-diamide synthase